MMTTKLLIPILTLTLLVPSLPSSPAAAEEDFVQPVDQKLMGLKKEQFSHIRLYWHDVQSGQNRSSFTVVPPVNTTATAFGTVNMIDNALTVGPDLRSSKLVGRAQGFYAAASQEEVSLLMAMNFVFTEGKYNGSSITLLGRNPVFNKGREMPVIGGSGLFRFATGYSNLTTYAFDLTTGNAVVEYNVYVKYYSSSSTRGLLGVGWFGLFISFLLTLIIHFSLTFN